MMNKLKYKNFSSEQIINDKESAAKFRTIRFKYAIATSLSSKVTSSVVQLIALPVAVRALGGEQFALYAMLAAAVGWIGLANVGIGPALVVNIASAAASGDNEAEKRLLTSALVPIIIVMILLGTVVFFSIRFEYLSFFFGNKYADRMDVIRTGISLLAGFTFLQTILTVVESAQTGYQEQYLQNLMSMLSNVMSVGAIFFVAKYAPSVIGMILAVNVFPFLFRIGNVILFFHRRPFLLPAIKNFNLSDCKSLLCDGLTFSLAGGLGNFLCHIFPVVLIGRMMDSNSAAAFVVAMNALIIASGVLSMVNIPLWPAISDSLTRSDMNWARRAYYRSLFYCMSYAFVVGIAFAGFGRQIFWIWFGASIQPSHSLSVFLGLYFVLLAWENIHYTILVGMKRMLFPSVLYLARSIFAVIVMFYLVNLIGETGPFIALSISTVVITMIPFTYFVYRELFNADLKYMISNNIEFR